MNKTRLLHYKQGKIMDIILIVVILNISLIYFLKNKSNKESLTIKTTESDVYFLLSDDIYLTMTKEQNSELTKNKIYEALQNYASELSKKCSNINILDKSNLISKEEVEKILYKS